MTIHQVSAGFDLNVDLEGLGWACQFGDVAVLDDAQSIGQNYPMPVNAPATDPAPWWFECWVVQTGNVGGSYSAGSVWKGVQFFTTPDARWSRKYSRVYSNGAITLTPWLKAEDFNCSGENY